MLLSDIYSLAIEKNRISSERTETKWHAVPYETNGFSGKLLVAAELSFPKKITLKLGLKGWHKIYLGYLNYTGSNSMHTLFRLTNDTAPSIVMPDMFNKQVVDGYNYWAPYQWMEEGFWKCADLTGQDLILEKPFNEDTCSCLAFIRVEEMSDAEIESYLSFSAPKNMMFHFDTDWLFWYNDYKSIEEYTNVVDRFSHGTGEIIVQETYFEDFEPLAEESLEAKHVRKNYQKRYRKYLENSDAITKAVINKAHQLGMSIYAGTRMEMGNFLSPLDCKLLAKKFVTTHPEYALYTRDGRKTTILSYSYKEVREWEINRLLKSVERGYDGVSLFFIRGVFVGFEKPVIERFKQWYGESPEITQLPISDSRVSKTMCSFITEFIQELRNKLDEFSANTGREKVKINAIVCYDTESSKFIGCDIETWLEQGLVDSISQGLMATYEDLDGCYLDEDNSLIDIEKYKQVLNSRAIIKRYHHDKAETVIGGAKTLLQLTEKYNVDFYASLPWQGKDPDYFVDLAQQQYRIGAKKLISWNANHVAENLSKVNLVKSLGDREIVERLPLKNMYYRKLYRVMSLDNTDISTYNPSWLG